uniref:Uncharacterized protein n=1 Tax=Knipowitschia caucasica TaxID=637954 RepID=A0AAV2LN90_KNICA
MANWIVTPGLCDSSFTIHTQEHKAEPRTSPQPLLWVVCWAQTRYKMRFTKILRIRRHVAPSSNGNMMSTMVELSTPLAPLSTDMDLCWLLL